MAFDSGCLYRRANLPAGRIATTEPTRRSRYSGLSLRICSISSTMRCARTFLDVFRYRCWRASILHGTYPFLRHLDPGPLHGVNRFCSFMHTLRRSDVRSMIVSTPLLPPCGVSPVWCRFVFRFHFFRFHSTCYTAPHRTVPALAVGLVEPGAHRVRREPGVAGGDEQEVLGNGLRHAPGCRGLYRCCRRLCCCKCRGGGGGGGVVGS